MSASETVVLVLIYFVYCVGFVVIMHKVGEWISKFKDKLWEDHDD